MQERKKKKKKDPQLDSFIPSIWYRGICYVLMSFQSYFKILWGCNLRGVVTDTQAQLGYIHHVRDVVTPSRKNFTERIINFPDSAQKPVLLTFPWKKKKKKRMGECLVDREPHSEEVWVVHWHFINCDGTKDVMGHHPYLFTELFLQPFYIFRFKYSTFSCINVSASV